MIETDLKLEATHLALRRIGPWLEELLCSSPIYKERPDHIEGLRGPIELAIHELATNSVDHAHSIDNALTVDGVVEGHRLTVELSDSGSPFDPESVTPVDPEKPRVRGYGMMIVEQVAESLSYDRRNEQNVWTVVFEL